MLREVARYAREIVPAFNAYVYFRLGSALARRLLHVLYRVRLGYADDAALARIAPNASVVFVMNHRSNADYLLVAYLAATRAALSYAVGEWARTWPLQSLIKALGGFFVRRGSDNPLYRRVLARYVQLATAGGVVQAFYPEGRFSRDGHLGPPRLGLLSYMVAAFDPQGRTRPRVHPSGDQLRPSAGRPQPGARTRPPGPVPAAGRTRWSPFCGFSATR